VFFRLAGKDEAFDLALKRYAAAIELSLSSSGVRRPRTKAKRTPFLQFGQMLQEHMLTAFEVTYQGKSQALIEWVRGKVPAGGGKRP